MRRTNVVLLMLLATVTVAAAKAQKSFSTNPYTVYGQGISNNIQFQIRAADFNDDGSPDVYVFGDLPNTDSRFVFNNGRGILNSIGPMEPYTGAKGYVQVVDLNGDGVPDLAVCSLSQNSPQWTLSTLINDRTGKYTVGSSLTLVGVCTSVSVGDANRDGKQDVVVTEYTGTNPVNNIIATYYGDGTGNVGNPTTQQNINLNSTSSAGTSNCEITDANGGNFNSDGNLSLILNTTCHPSSSAPLAGTTFLASSIGNGQFTFTQLRAGPEALSNGKTFDVNKDGRPDTVFVSQNANGTSSLYYAQNNGSKNFTFNDLTSTLPLGSSVSQFVGATVADFNGDGANDIAVTYMTGTRASGNAYISILNGNGSSGFTESQHWLVGDSSTTLLGDLTSADFNRDGKPDLATTYWSPANGDLSVLEYLNTPGTDSCAVPSTPHTSVICTPAAGSSISSPFTITAASNEPGFVQDNFYLDGKLSSFLFTQSVDFLTAFSVGTHQLTMVSYSNQGGSISSNSTFNVATSGGTGPCVPTGPGVRICSPVDAYDVTSALDISAGAIATSGNITAIRVYEDYNSIGTFYNPSASNSFSFSQPFLIDEGGHTLTVVAYESTGAVESSSIDITSNGATGCASPGVPVRICFPVPNSTVPTTFIIGVGATATSQASAITGIRAYIDNVQSFFVNQFASALEAQREVTVSPGSHHLVVIAYQGSQPPLVASEYFTASPASCYPPKPGAIICSPANNASVSSPVQFSAGATVASGYVTSVRIYVDNVAKATVNNPQKSPSYAINPAIALPQGMHSVVVVGYSSTGAAVSTSETISVQ